MRIFFSLSLFWSLYFYLSLFWSVSFVLFLILVLVYKSLFIPCKYLPFVLALTVWVLHLTKNIFFKLYLVSTLLQYSSHLFYLVLHAIVSVNYQSISVTFHRFFSGFQFVSLLCYIFTAVMCVHCYIDCLHGLGILVVYADVIPHCSLFSMIIICNFSLTKWLT